LRPPGETPPARHRKSAGGCRASRASGPRRRDLPPRSPRRGHRHRLNRDERVGQPGRLPPPGYRAPRSGLMWWRGGQPTGSCARRRTGGDDGRRLVRRAATRAPARCLRGARGEMFLERLRGRPDRDQFQVRWPVAPLQQHLAAHGGVCRLCLGNLLDEGQRLIEARRPDLDLHDHHNVARDAHAAPAAMSALLGRRRSWPGLWLAHRLPAGQNAGPQAPLARLVPFGRILATQPIAGADLEAHRANAVRPAVLVSHVPVMASWSRSETVVRQSRTSVLRWPSTKPAAEPIRPERRLFAHRAASAVVTDSHHISHQA
jgi:hypothetical protein